MPSSVTLRGITWNHARGWLPLVATAKRFRDRHPEIRIQWEKHSLKTFEASPVAALAATYDLLVLDHPCVCAAAPGGALLPLDEHLAPAFLADQATHAAGLSHASYTHAGHQWALAIDAAAPVAFWRADLLDQLECAVPRTWDEVLALARLGHVDVPAAPINCLMNFFSLCTAVGEEPFVDPGRVVSSVVGAAALRRLRELLARCDAGCWTRDPIASLDLAASAGNRQICYGPLAYGYSNYARAGYTDHRIEFGEPPLFAGQPLRTVLGGAGLGVSARSRHRREALAYAKFVASARTQRGLYTRSGGQPGHRAAWLDAGNNRLTGDYFKRTLPVLDRAWLRPQFRGYLGFQERAARIVHSALRGELSDAAALARLEEAYRDRPHDA